MHSPSPTTPQAGSRRRWYTHLYVQVIVAIAAGVALGHFAPQTGEASSRLAMPSSSW